MARWTFVGSVCLALWPCACAQGVAAPPGSPVAASSPAPAAAPLPVAEAPDVDLRDRDRAVARGRLVEFDGVSEGLAWPSLEKALAGHAPGGAVTLQAARVERAACPIRYVAFGAESDDAPWGAAFDVVLAVDCDRSAGDARYVLGQAMHAKPPAVEAR